MTNVGFERLTDLWNATLIIPPVIPDKLKKYQHIKQTIQSSADKTETQT